jgi:hypothetical protein
MNSLSKSSPPHAFNLNTALGLLVGISALYLGREVLIPIALALLLSFLLTPAMVWATLGAREDLRSSSGHFIDIRSAGGCQLDSRGTGL